MKLYRILTIPFLALCLFSCAGSGQEEPDVPTKPEEPKGVSISFGGNSGTWQDAPTTRANKETGLETISKSFKVWGYKTIGGNNTGGFDHYQNVMDGYLVNWTQQTANPTSSNTADWEYVGIHNDKLNTNQTIKYWDYSATSYRFFAYSIPTTAAGNSTAPIFLGTSNNRRFHQSPCLLLYTIQLRQGCNQRFYPLYLRPLDVRQPELRKQEIRGMRKTHLCPYHHKGKIQIQLSGRKSGLHYKHLIPKCK